MEKLSDDEIHQILDHYGNSRLQVMNYQGLQDAVNFTDPLMASVQTNQQEVKDREDDEVIENSYQEQHYQNSPSDETFGSPGFLQSNWHQLFDIKDYLHVLKDKALHGRLGHSPFRGTCWKLFWECLPEERDQWIDATTKFRADYERVRDKHLTDPYKTSEADLAVNNPLSQEADSPWHQYFQDSELRSTITRDVDRLYPEMEFFRKNEIDDMILRCLFVYAKEHPHIVYKQGMHEIIAPVVYVLWDNAQNIKDSKEDLQDIIHIMNDQNYVEHDAYCLFKEIMDSSESMFVSLSVPNDDGNSSKQKVADVDNLFLSSTTVQQSTTAISKKLTRIQNYMLKRYDHQLYSHLQDLEIAPQVYGIRWIRLLFGREYPLSSLLYIWDAIFADGRSMALLDFIFIAMLINIRNLLLKNDYSACLLQLMKYPSTTDAKMILRKALSLRSYKPNVPRQKHPMRSSNRGFMNRNESLRRNLSQALTEQQKFAHALGSGRQQLIDQTSKVSKQSQWYADISSDNTDSHKPGTSEGRAKKEEFAQEIKRSNRSFTNLNEAKVESFEQESKRAEKPPRAQIIKANVVSQISNAIGKHKVALPSDVLSKFASRGRNRPKEDVVTQLEEDHERLQKQISQLQTEYDRIQSLCLFCAGKMHSYLGFIETSKDDVPAESDLIKSCLTGLAKVRDILAKTTDVEITTESYERQFASIDKSLSEAFADKKMSTDGIQDDSSLLCGKEDHFGEPDVGEPWENDVTNILDSEREEASMSDVRAGSSDDGNQEDFDYLGYMPSTEKEQMSSNNSDSNLSDSKSSSSSLATPEPWASLKPAAAAGDFEKELLLIKDRYGTTSDGKDGNENGTEPELEPVDTQDGDISLDKSRNEMNDSLDPLSALEKHFNEM